MKLFKGLGRGFLLVCCVCFSVLALAQDARFTNVSATRQLTNPAFTGVMPGGLRATANYRELYTSLLGSDAYRSYAAGVELRRRAGSGNYFGFGAQLQRDEAGTSDFQRTQGLLSLSYQQQILGSSRGDEGHYLTGGVQAGFGQRGFDLNKLWFSSQYFVDESTREAYIDRTMASGEAFGGNGSGTYLDVNAGLGWFAGFGDRKGAYAGIAAYHLNAPNVSPIEGDQDDLDQRFVAHGGGELPLGRGYSSVLPQVRVMVQGPAIDILLGSYFRYSQREWQEIAFRAGLLVQGSNQSGDQLKPNAAIVSVALETERLQFMLNYDISLGDLNTVSNGRAGLEFGLVYQQAAKYRNIKVVCPKF